MTRNDLPSGHKLGNLHHKGVTLTDLAIRFGCNRQTIANRIRSVGKEIKHIRNPRHPNLQLPSLNILNEEYKTKTLRQLAKKYNVSHQTISNRLKVNNNNVNI